MRVLLLLIDLQDDYLALPGLEPAAASIVDQTRRVLTACRGRGMPVAHVWTSVDRQSDQRMQHWKQAGVWRCEVGTPGHATPEALAPASGEAIIHKTGFSGFEAPDLAELVAERGIDTLLLCGVHLHACIRQTILDAQRHGLHSVVAEPAVGSNDPLHAAVTRQYLAARAVRFVSVDELLREPGDTFRPVGGTGLVTDSVGAAVRRAAAVQRSWARRNPASRAELVAELAATIEASRETLAREMTRDIGKPLYFARAEVDATLEMLHAIAARTRDQGDMTDERPLTVRRRAHGVVALITPWNNPFYIPIGKLIPALLYGNTVVWKPAPEATALAERLLALMCRAAWPPDLVCRVDGGREIGEVLMNETGISAVSITGSSPAGYAAQAICARRRIPLQAELGGNNAAIVMADADLANAARCIAAGAFEQAGQRCTANKRVVVESACLDRFIELLAGAAAELPWGNPLRENTRIGPLVNERHRERVAAMVERAVARGVPAWWPHGQRPPGDAPDGAWHPPVILYGEEPAMEIVQEEVFGPVLVVQPARDWHEAIALCNGVRHGLVASVFTGRDEVIDRFLDQADAGILKVNQSTAAAQVDAPFGGWKASGIGPPEHGEFDREFYTRAQSVYGMPSGLGRR